MRARARDKAHQPDILHRQQPVAQIGRFASYLKTMLYEPATR